MCQYSDSCENDECIGCYTYEKWCNKMNEIYNNWIPITENEKEKLIEKNEYIKYLNSLNNQNKKILRRAQKLVWLTVRPQKCEESVFKTFIEKLLEWKCIENYYCAYEWKPNEESSGLHAHIILKGENKRIMGNIAKKRKGKTFKKVGKCLFFSKLINATDLQDKIDYCNGKTKDVEKNKQKKINPELRIKYNMPNLNSFNLEN